MRTIYKTSADFKLLFAGFFFALLAFHAGAQVKIGTNGNIIAPSSILELESSNQGLLLPRLSDTVAINALNPPNGMLIYLTKAPAVGLYVRKVAGWEFLTGSLGGNANYNSLTVAGSVTAGSFSGPLTGNATSATTATTATNAINSGVTNDLATSTAVYPTFVTSTPGNLPLRTSNTNLSFVPSTGILTAKGFSGPLVGNVTGTATLAIDATNAANTNITNDITTNALHYPTFVSGTTGNLPQKTSSPNLTFNPGTGILSATGFNGNLTGNATTSTNATTTTVTDDNATAAVTYPTFVTATAGNWGQRTSSAKLTFVPSTGVLTASGFTSTVPTGTAPFTVASSTTVANLSATNAANVNITDDVATLTPTYPTFVLGTAGNQGERTSSSRLSFIPSTGALSATSFSGAGTGLTGNAAGLNAGTATALQTARNINGTAFDGTSNITVTAAAGTLTGNTLNNTVLFSSLTSVGTLTNGTWNAGTVTTTQLRGKTASTPPTTTAGAGAGNAPTIAISGNDLAGLISVTVGSAVPAGSNTLVTVNYVNGNFPTGSFPVLFPANSNAAGQSAQISATGANGSFTITTNSPLVSGTTYTWNYHVIGN